MKWPKFNTRDETRTRKTRRSGDFESSTIEGDERPGPSLPCTERQSAATSGTECATPHATRQATPFHDHVAVGADLVYGRPDLALVAWSLLW
jgi:hypothetical protein